MDKELMTKLYEQFVEDVSNKVVSKLLAAQGISNKIEPVTVPVVEHIATVEPVAKPIVTKPVAVVEPIIKKNVRVLNSGNYATYYKAQYIESTAKTIDEFNTLGMSDKHIQKIQSIYDSIPDTCKDSARIWGSKYRTTVAYIQNNDMHVITSENNWIIKGV